MANINLNEDQLVMQSVIGEIHSPQLSNPYRVSYDGTLKVYPSTGGITYNKRIGDYVCKMKADHVEPAVTIKNSSETANGALNTFSCIGNEAFVVSGDAKGEKGFVTGVLERIISQEKVDYAIAVGPMPMMKAVADMTRDRGIYTEASMNPIMVDGTGMCGACRVTVGGETKFACVDGPDFNAHLIDFDEVINRTRIYKDQEQKRNENCNLFKMADRI